jgi:hypothetical protein
VPEGHCCIEAKAVLTMHQVARQTPQASLRTVTNRAYGRPVRGFWVGKWSVRVARTLNATALRSMAARSVGWPNNYQGQRAGRPHVVTWAELEVTLGDRPKPW